MTGCPFGAVDDATLGRRLLLGATTTAFVMGALGLEMPDGTSAVSDRLGSIVGEWLGEDCARRGAVADDPRALRAAWERDDEACARLGAVVRVELVNAARELLCRRRHPNTMDGHSPETYAPELEPNYLDRRAPPGHDGSMAKKKQIIDWTYNEDGSHTSETTIGGFYFCHLMTDPASKTDQRIHLWLGGRYSGKLIGTYESVDALNRGLVTFLLPLAKARADELKTFLKAAGRPEFD